MKKVLISLLVATSATFSAIGDIINIGQGSLQDMSSSPGGVAGLGTWAYFSRPTFEIGVAQGDDIVVAKSNGAEYTHTIPTQSEDYILALYGKEDADEVVSVSIDGGTEEEFNYPAIDGNGNHKVKIREWRVSKDEHNFKITSKTDNWTHIDYFVIGHLPIKYTSNNATIDNNFDGVVGTVSTFNRDGSDAGAFVVMDPVIGPFSLSGSELSFKTPDSPEASYSVKLIATVEGLTDTVEVSVDVNNQGGGNSISQAIFYQESYVKVYDMQGQYITSTTEANWLSNAAQLVENQEIYVVRTYSSSNVLQSEKIQVLR